MRAIFAFIVILFFILTPIRGSAMPTPSSFPLSEGSLKEKINLNQANAKSLIHIVPGIGKKRAAAIIQYREEHGSFKSIEELAYVRGLGKRFVINHLTQLIAALTIE